MWSVATRRPRPPAGTAMRGAALALALLTVALVHADGPRARRAEISPVPFVMGSRYGRSPERVMAPRNDRFFMGSRYGKRSGAEETRIWEGCEGGECRLLCQYAGAPNLYKCARTHGHLHYTSRSSADSRASGEE